MGRICRQKRCPYKRNWVHLWTAFSSYVYSFILKSTWENDISSHCGDGVGDSTHDSWCFRWGKTFDKLHLLLWPRARSAEPSPWDPFLSCREAGKSASVRRADSIDWIPGIWNYTTYGSDVLKKGCAIPRLAAPAFHATFSYNVWDITYVSYVMHFALA